MVCSICASACRPDIIALPLCDRAAEDRHPVVDVELPSALLAEAVALHDAVIVLVPLHLHRHVLAHAHAPLRGGHGAAVLLARDRQAEDAAVGGDGLHDQVVVPAGRVSLGGAPDAG